jgi:predicted amidohydrolase
VRIHLARWVCLDPESNLARVAEEADTAAASGSELCIYPESFLHGYTRKIDPKRIRETFGAVSGAHPSMTFFFGSHSEDGHNRMTVWRDRAEIARYDKVHLFAPNGELEIWKPGDRYAAVQVGDLRIGLVNCNDIRFPEQARALRLKAKVDALVVVAWWPWRRDHVWSTLLRARAIENCVFVAGCCVALSEYPGERFAGAGNHVFDPLGEPLRSPDDRTYDLDRSKTGPLVVDPLTTYVEIERVETF